MQGKEIALVKETRKNQFVSKIMETIAPYLSLKSSDRVAIKINLSGSKEIYANTSYATIEALIQYLKERFAVSDIAVIEGSDGAYYSGRSTWDIFYKFKYREIELVGARLVNLDELPHECSLIVDTLQGQQTVQLACFDCDYLISVVPPKTHNILPVCLSVPNLLGFVKPEQRNMIFGIPFAEMKKVNFFQQDVYSELVQLANRNLVRLLGQVKPRLAIIDGLYGMEGKGPVKGSPVFHGFAIAAEDAVLADALATYVMGFNVEDVPYLTMAFHEGLGHNRWQSVIGIDPQMVRFPYRPHPLFQRQRKWLKNSQANEPPQQADNGQVAEY